MRRLYAAAASVLALALAPSAGAVGPPLVVDNDGADCAGADFTSIQAAVTAASPGSTILVCAGTYHEAVTVSTSDLSLRAKGPPGDVVVDADNAFAALHVLNASGVMIEGFFVREGHEADILFSNSNDGTIRKNLTTAAGHDGIQLRLGSSGNLVEHNVSFDNLAFNACGINLTTGATGNLVRHNVTFNNNWGLQLAGGANLNTLFGNESFGNRSHGARIIGGANANTLENNQTWSNTVYGIGIHGSTGLTVARNHAFGNGVADIFTDTVAGNTFENNHCNTSSPSGLCEHTEGNGH